MELYLRYEQELTDLLMKEVGKPRVFANIEIKDSAAHLTWNASLDLPVENLDHGDKTIVTKYVPLGVVGAICPWNFPVVLSVGKIAPALVSGCTIIVKPSPFTPYTSLKICGIAQEIFPPGVFQVLGGDDKLGPWMTKHPGIQKIAFTGSTATGKRIMASCASTLKRVTLELGGNDACIVCPDVDIPSVAPSLVMGAMFNSGQVCVATKRIYIHSSIYAPMLKAMSEFASSLKVGQGHEDGVMIGPIQNAMQYERVKGFFEEGATKGYKYAAGGKGEMGEKGYFITPTIVDNPPDDSRIILEEPFGPIVPTQPWDDEEEVITRANNTTMGLGACVWSKDIDRAVRIGGQLEAGSIWINSAMAPSPKAAFGGHKESGIGSEYGTKSLLSFCNTQVLHVPKAKM